MGTSLVVSKPGIIITAPIIVSSVNLPVYATMAQSFILA